MVDAGGLYVIMGKCNQIQIDGRAYFNIGYSTCFHPCSQTTHQEYLDSGWRWAGPLEVVKW